MCDGVLYTIRFMDSTMGTNSSYDNKEVHSCHRKGQSKSHRNHLVKDTFLSKICVSTFFNQRIHGKSCSQQEAGSFY